MIATVQLIPEMRLDRSSLLQLRALSRGVDRYIAVSRDVARRAGRRGFGWPAEKVEVVYNAVDLDRVAAAGAAGPARRADRRQRSARSSSPPPGSTSRRGTRSCSGRPPQVPDAVFVLAGEGPRREALEARGRRAGRRRPRPLPRRAAPTSPELLAACDVFALPSLYEGSSLAVLEAMAAAPARRQLGDRRHRRADRRRPLAACWCRPGDADALAAALRRLIGDGELRALARRPRPRAGRAGLHPRGDGPAGRPPLRGAAQR